jgi:hypothetical protein
MYLSFAHDVRDRQVVDAATQVLYSFRRSRQLGRIPSDVDHTAFNR